MHPAVYFYSEKGRYQPTAFMAWITILQELEKENAFSQFTKSRGLFEKVLLSLKHVTNQVTVKYGSGLKGYKQLANVYKEIYIAVSKDSDIDKIRVLLKAKFPYLNLEYKGDVGQGVNFNKNTKSEVFLNTALGNASKCPICDGYVHLNSMTIDHITRKQEGGLGIAGNGQISHPYCNTTFKN